MHRSARCWYLGALPSACPSDVRFPKGETRLVDATSDFRRPFFKNRSPPSPFVACFECPVESSLAKCLGNEAIRERCPAGFCPDPVWWNLELATSLNLSKNCQLVDLWIWSTELQIRFLSPAVTHVSRYFLENISHRSECISKNNFHRRNIHSRWLRLRPTARALPKIENGNRREE